MIAGATLLHYAWRGHLALVNAWLHFWGIQMTCCAFRLRLPADF
jgi:hypothetical protein